MKAGEASSISWLPLGLMGQGVPMFVDRTTGFASGVKRILREQHELSLNLLLKNLKWEYIFKRKNQYLLGWCSSSTKLWGIVFYMVDESDIFGMWESSRFLMIRWGRVRQLVNGIIGGLFETITDTWFPLGTHRIELILYLIELFCKQYS